MNDAIVQQGSDVIVRIKVVPGASRSELAGALGDRLKVRIAAPPEGGKANLAVCEFIARAVGMKRGAVTIEAGQTQPMKTVRIEGANVDVVRRALT